MNLLLVDDDQRIVNFVKRGLEAEGYHVDVALNGEEGLEYGRNPYTLIILDLLLPGINGTEVCRTLRKDKIHTPILMLTARDGVQDKVDGLRTGADDYLTKPFAFEELLARIQALLRRGAYQDIPTTFHILDLCLHKETREVTRAGRPITLTAKEFALLAYLMSHPNRPLSRTMILEHVWGYHHDTLTNVVDVYIRYLRNKVDKGFPQKLI
ncbi:MAG: response regulator transcription factor, partial [Nitrospirota bacterium]|nr:response regulator transcription factor [Nitrospirota bacterium]